MICQKCRTNLPDEAKFCSVCGSVISQVGMTSGYEMSPDLEPAPMIGGNMSYEKNATYANQYSSTVGYDERTAYMSKVPAYSAIDDIETVSSYDASIGPRAQALSVLRSPVFLILGIGWLFGVLLNFVSLFGALDDASVFMYVEDGVIALVFLIAIFAMTPQLLCGIGFTVAAAKSRSGGCGGLGAAKASFIIILVLLAIAMTIVMIGALVSFGEIMEYREFGYGRSYFSEALAAFLISMIIVVGVFVMLIVFCAKVVSSLSVIQNAVNDNICHHKSSIYAVVMCFLISTFGFVSVIVSVASGSIMLIISAVTGMLNYVLLGIAIATIRKVDISLGRRSPLVNAYPADGSVYPRY